MQKLAFSDLVDIGRLQELMDQFHDLTSIPVGILDPEGKILVATGWQEICTEFHRVNPETERRCRASDAYIKSHLHDGGYVAYKCKNGLWDVAVPIVVYDRHVATMFCGQFFYEDEVVDEAYFRDQARRFGFDEEQYIAALKKAPVLSRGRVEKIMRYYSTFVSFLSTLGHHNLRLSEEVAERTAAEKRLQLSERRFRKIYDEAPVLIQSVDEHGIVKSVNNKWLSHLGYEPDEVIGLPLTKFLDEEARKECAASFGRLWSEGRTDNVSQGVVTRDGHTLETLVDSAVVMDPSWGRVSLAVVRDVTAQRRAERALKEAHQDLERQVAERTRDLQESVRLLSIEVEQRKKAERQLGEANQFKSKLLAALPVGILTFRANGQCVSANEAAASAAGMSAYSLVSRNLRELEPWKSSGLMENAQVVLSFGEEKQIELRLPREDGEDIFLSCTVTGFTANNEAHFLMITHDITQRKRFERELRRSLDFLRIRDRIAGVFLAASDDEMLSEVLRVVLDEVESPMGVFGYVNEDGAMVCPFMARTVWDQCQLTDKAAVFPREMWGGIWGKALVEKRTLCSNESFSVPEGHHPIFSHIAVPLVYGKEIVGILQAFNKEGGYNPADVDLMESIGAYIAPILSARIGRQREERERRRAEEALEATLNSTTEIVLLLSPSGTIVEVNESGAKFLGASRREVQGRCVFDLLPNGIAKLRSEKLACVARTLAPERWQDKQGATVFENTAYPVIVNEKADRVAVFAQDITQRIHAEEQLRKHSAALEAANQELQHFAYVASHDLREPLRKMANFASLLGKSYSGQIDERADRYINYVLDGAVRMQGLIDDLLLYSRTGREELVKERVNIEETLERILDDLEPLLEAASAQVTHDELPVVEGHISQLGRLFQNLLTNAIKFRSEQEPRIHVCCEKTESGWTFCVSDNGIGIDPEQSERVFGIFQRLHTREEYPGAGIGLAVCKKIVELHGGRIWVESGPEEGSKFFFTLPEDTQNI